MAAIRCLKDVNHTITPFIRRIMCNITKEKLYNIIRDNKIMDDAGTTFVVLNENLQVLYVNYTSVEESLGLNPGDLLKCSNAMEAEHGCGTHENCKLCKLRNMVESSISTRSKMESDVELLVSENSDYSFHAISTPFIYEDKIYTVVLLVDKTDQHREFMMERIFFHDLLNLSGALNGILDCMQFGDPEEMMHIVRGISNQLMDEITAQRDLIYAKNGILQPKAAEFLANETISFVKDSLIPVAMDMWAVTLVVESSLTEEVLHSDKALVNRVVHNMVKNACEASSGTTVTVKGWSTDDKVTFSVHNDAVMPNEVKSKVFIYGNSTKGSGRGLGTYSMKLIGENYLHGRVWFKSEEGFGTEFYFEIDRVK